MSEYGSHEILGAAQSANGPEAVFGQAGTSFEPKGTHPTEVIHIKKVYRYMSGQFFSLID